MVVTGIEELTKSRSRVRTDEEEEFVVYKGELRKYRLEEGKPVSKEDYEELMHTVLPKRAKLRSMNLLKAKEYTENQLRDKLKQGGYPKEVIDEAVQYVKSYHYVDDDRYAAAYIEYQIDKRSRQRIVQDLMKKGISRECIEKQWRYLEELGVTVDEENMISEWLKKKNYCDAEADIKEKRRMYGFLLRKGFSAEKISKVLRS